MADASPAQRVEITAKSASEQADDQPLQLSRGKRLLFILIIFLIIFGVPEIATRILAPEYVNLRFGQHITAGHPIGLRGGDLHSDLVTAPKAPGEIRLAMLGDSVTWGYGLPAEDTVAEQTKRKLQAARPDITWQIVNMGRMGSTPKMRRELLLDKIETWPTDGIIFQFHLNDVAWTDREMEEIGPSLKPGFRGLFTNKCRRLRVEYMRYSAFYAYMEELTKQIYFRIRGPSDPERDEMAACCDSPAIRQRWDEQFQAIADFKAACDRKDIGFRVYMYPQSEHLSDEPRDNLKNVDRSKFTVNPYDRFMEYLAKYNLTGRHLFDVLKAQRDAMLAGKIPYDRLFFVLDTNHPNKRGAELFAQALAEDILAGKFCPIPPPSHQPDKAP